MTDYHSAIIVVVTLLSRTFITNVLTSNITFLTAGHQQLEQRPQHLDVGATSGHVIIYDSISAVHFAKRAVRCQN